MTKPRLNVSGWINLNHSFSVVTQNHLYWLAKSGQFDLRLHQPDFPVKAWADSVVEPGWDAESKAVLTSIPPTEPSNDVPLLNFSYPFDTLIDIPNQLRFIVTEFGLVKSNLRSLDSLQKLKALRHIITPSQWSKQRLVDMGFLGDRITVVPHGYNPSIYYPASPAERSQIRANLGIHPDEFCICNVGALTWNKGIDILLDAVYQVWREHKGVRLILKDAQSLFRISGQEFVLNHFSRKGMEKAFLSAVRVISADLTPNQLRELYVGADLYLSPYRAEGFNLPALEASACGTPVLCTQGGATDDFLPAACSLVSKEFGQTSFPDSLRVELAQGDVGAFLQVEEGALAKRLRQTISLPEGLDQLGHHTEILRDQWSWKTITEHSLLGLLQ